MRSVAGVMDLSVNRARGLCAAAFIVSATCLVYGAITSVSSSVFTSFVIPTVLGAISGVVLPGVLLGLMLLVELLKASSTGAPDPSEASAPTELDAHRRALRGS